jgi:hypothetical protein
MAKLQVKITRSYNLTLDDTELKFLKNYLQNPLYDDESEQDLLTRKTIWEALPRIES